MAPSKEFREPLLIGVPSVDDAHRRLFDLLGHIDAAVAGGNLRAAAQHLRQFVGAFNGHVESEAALLDSLGYRDIERRRAEHLSGQAIFSDHPLEEDDIELVRQAAVYARAWLLDHVVRQDLPLRPFYAEKGWARKTPRRLWQRFDILKLRYRITLLAIVPLLALGGLAITASGELRRTADEMALLRRMNGLNGEVGAVVHELQRERGLSAIYVSDQTGDRQRLEAQIERSDLAVARLERSLSELGVKLQARAVQDTLQDARAALELVPEVREDVVAGSFDAVQTIDIYTTAITDLVSVVPEVIRATFSSDFAKNTFAYVFLLEAKERAGRERAVGAATLAGGRRIRMTKDIKELASEQAALEDGFMSVATPDLARAHRDLLGEGPSAALSGMRNALQAGNVANLTAQEWFDTASQRIDRMRDLEVAVSARLETDVSELEGRALSRMMLLGGGMAALVALSLAMVALLGWTILPPLRRLGGTMRSLAEGDRSPDIPDLTGRDEVGEMARTLQFLRERLVYADLVGARRWTENAERLRAVTDNLPGVVFRVIRTGGGTPIVACISRKLREVAGISSASVVDVPLRTLLRRLARPADWPALLHALHRAGRHPIELEFRLREPMRNGKPRWLRVVASPSRTEGGWVWDGVALDVTAMKQAEEERSRVVTELARFQRMQAASQLAGSLGHEFNSLLQPILSSCERANDAVPAEAPARRHLGDAIEATQQARQLVDRVLGIKRRDASTSEPIDLVATVAECLEVARPFVPHHVVVRTTLDGTGALAAVSATEVHQVVTHLCTNAVHAMGLGGGVLSVGTRIVAGSGDDRRGPFLQLSVGDTGCGMTQEALAQAFNGTGLTVVRSIVSGCGGWIDVTSQPGIGTVFELHFPVKPNLSNGAGDNVVSFSEANKWRTSKA